MALEIYALFNTNDCPHRLKSSGDDEFYYYFPPPLPELIVLFMVTKEMDEINVVFKVTVCIDNDLDDKYIGVMGNDKLSICWNGSWTKEEINHAKRVQKLGRVLKLSVFKEDIPEVNTAIFDSERLLSHNYLNSSIDSLETELDENQMAIKKLHQNINEKNKKSTKENIKKRKNSKSVEDGKPIEEENGEKTMKNRNEDFDNLFDFEDDLPLKSPKKVNGSKLGGKRNSPFSNKLKVSKKSCAEKTPEKYTKIMKKTAVASPSYAVLFSDVLPTKNPSNRWGHCFCKTEDDHALVIGGEGANKVANADSIWSLDTNTSTWQSQPTNDLSIAQRVGHTVCYDSKSKMIYLYGGIKQDNWYSDVHILDMNCWQWSKIETIGKAPTRAYHSCTMDGDELLIFGGIFPTLSSAPYECSNELLIFNKDSKSWYSPIVSGDIPPKRSGHTACLIGMKLYIFGGCDEHQYFDDMYVLDLGIMNFVKQSMIGSVPSSRKWHALHLFSDEKRFCVYGGYDGERALDDLYIFHTLDNSWTKMFYPGLVCRAGHSIIRRSNDCGERLLVFGGGDNQGNFYNDLATIVLS